MKFKRDFGKLTFEANIERLKEIENYQIVRRTTEVPFVWSVFILLKDDDEKQSALGEEVVKITTTKEFDVEGINVILEAMRFGIAMGKLKHHKRSGPKISSVDKRKLN